MIESLLSECFITLFIGVKLVGEEVLTSTQIIEEVDLEEKDRHPLKNYNHFFAIAHNPSIASQNKANF